MSLRQGAFPVIANAREAEHWRQIFDAERQAVLAAFAALQQRFGHEIDTPPARLVRRRAGGLIWRLRAATPVEETLFALTSATGRALLQHLSPRLRRFYLDIEAERLKLNARYRIANTATRSLTHYLDRYAEVRALRKSLESN